MAGPQRLKSSPEPVDIRVRLRRYLRVLWICRASAISVAAGLTLALLTPVHDLFLDITGVDAPDLAGHPVRDLAPPLWRGFSLALQVTAFWALPVHAVARLAVSDPSWLGSPYVIPARREVECNAARFATPATWIPRWLGLVCYVAAILAALLAWRNLPIVADEPLGLRVRNAIAADVGALAVFAALFFIYAVFRRPLVNRFLLTVRKLNPPKIGYADEGDKLGAGIDINIARVILALLIVALIFPALLDLFPRLSLAPLLLGVWTPIVGLVARYGYRWRLPLGVMATVAGFALFYALGDNHASDVIANAAVARPTLSEAVAAWKRANCADGPCPSPIVALVSGGASRSGFFAVSALGLLTDVSCETAGDGPCPAPSLFRRRLFAISSVSGGSVGAAVYARAIADAGSSGAPPCAPGRPSTRYFRADAAGWRGCLQKILAEDFLSPVIAGLGFRDVVGFAAGIVGPCAWPDRGRRIERAIADAYLGFTGKTEPGCAADRRRGLDAPFTALAPKTDAAAVWAPILLLNATASESGKRFVFSGVAPEAGGTRWLQDGYDFHESFPQTDIRLVAAAHDSARFPVISPAGALYGDACKAAEAEGFLARLLAGFEREPCSKLVDGGYFDNYGASTASDLVIALRAEGLRAFVLLITNDPDVDDHAAFALGGRDGKPLDLTPVPSSWPIPPLVAAPLSAALNTATARGELALEQLRRLVAPPSGAPDPVDPSCQGAPRPNDDPCFALVAVHGPDDADESAERIRDRLQGVSMSWWLSKPVQQYLDNQLEMPLGPRQRALVRADFDANAASLKRVCAVMAGGDFAKACAGRIAALAH